jgi:hypothetical protein
MRPEEEINKLKLANTILNRSTKRLGIRPLNVGEFQNPYVAEKRQRPTYKYLGKRNIGEIAAKLKKEQETNINFKKTTKMQTAIYSVLTIVVVFFLVFVFNPAEIIASFSVNSRPNPQLLVKTDNDVSDKARELVVCSGVFNNINDANKYKSDLSERLGVPLKVLKDGSIYTVQIGPAYKSHEDAVIVFDELSRYSVSNLSLRFAS